MVNSKLKGRETQRSESAGGELRRRVEGLKVSVPLGAKLESVRDREMGDC